MLSLLVIASAIIATPAVFQAWRNENRPFAMTIAVLSFAAFLFLFAAAAAKTEDGIGAAFVSAGFAAVTIIVSVSSLAFALLRKK